MADDTSTTDTAAVDTSAEESVDTSTNEDSLDTDGELEDITVTEEEMDGGDDDDDETEEPDESYEDKAATESTDDKPEQSEEDEGNQSPDEEANGEDTAPEVTSAEDRKRLNDEMAKRRIAEKQLREQQQLREQEQLARFLDEAGDDELEYQKRLLQVEAFNIQKEKVNLNTDRLQNGIDKAVATIDLFRNGSQEVKEALADSLDDFEARYVVRDKNGDPIEVRGDVYQFLQNKAESIKRLTNVGARQQSKDKTNASARTVTTPSRTPKEAKKDPDLEAFDAEWDKYDS